VHVYAYITYTYIQIYEYIYTYVKKYISFFTARVSTRAAALPESWMRGQHHTHLFAYPSAVCALVRPFLLARNCHFLAQLQYHQLLYVLASSSGTRWGVCLLLESRDALTVSSWRVHPAVRGATRTSDPAGSAPEQSMKNTTRGGDGCRH